MERTAVDRPDTRLAQRLLSLQRRAGTGAAISGDLREIGECLVVTAGGHGPDLDGTGRGGIELGPAVSLLRESRAPTVVVVGSALVYGAWADNPVPLTEEAPLRPCPESSAAVAYAELERVAASLRAPGRTIAVLRPTTCVDPGAGRRLRYGASGWRGRSTRPARGSEGHDRPAQFLLLDDLARAVEHARLRRLDGVFNVAPPGWLSTGEQSDLVGSTFEVRMSAPATRAADLLHRCAVFGAPGSEAAYGEHPWVISSDRLRATGWEPSFTNEEAFVMGNRPGWWSTLNPDQRQVVSLGAMAGATAAAAWATIGIVRRASRRARGD